MLRRVVPYCVQFAMALPVFQRPGSLFLLLLQHIETPSKRVCCAPGLLDSALQVTTGSFRCIMIIASSLWRLPETRRCLALAAEDRKSEVRSQPFPVLQRQFIQARMH